MDFCSCGWHDEALGSMVRGPHVARRAVRSRDGQPYVCPNCRAVVKPGQRCVDFAGLDGDGGGFFYRFHAECFELMRRCANKFCDGEWCVPFDLEEAAQNIALIDDTEWARAWLLDYERTWAFSEIGGG